MSISLDIFHLQIHGQHHRNSQLGPYFATSNTRDDECPARHDTSNARDDECPATHDTSNTRDDKCPARHDTSNARDDECPARTSFSQTEANHDQICMFIA